MANNKTNVKVDESNTLGTQFLLKDLIKNCEKLGYAKEIVAGAFYNHNTEEKVSKEEFNKIISTFLKRKVN